MKKKLLILLSIITSVVMGVRAEDVASITIDGTTTNCSRSVDARDAAPVSWTEVSTVSQFKDAVKRNANVRLTADLDLSSFSKEEDEMLFDDDFTFTGKISGKYTNNEGKEAGHFLVNCKYVIFQKLSGATIEYVTFYNCSFNGFDTGSGLLAVEAENTNVSNVSLVNCSFKGESDGNDKDQMGGLIGKAKDCRFTMVCVFDTKLVTDGQNAGLLVGKAEGCHFDYCITNGTSSLWADGNQGNAFAGGLCGNATGGSFTHCTNYALVTAKDDEVGGIVGQASGVSITDCLNAGIVCHCDQSAYNELDKSRAEAMDLAWKSGAIGSGLGLGAALIMGFGESIGVAIGYGYTAIGNVLANILAYGAIAAAGAAAILIPLAAACVVAAVTYTIILHNYEPDEAGGIAGRIESSSKVLRCSNYGPVTCFDAYAGGIVGYADASAIECCLNQSVVRGQQQCGGIVGYLNNSKLCDNINMSAVMAEENLSMVAGIENGSNTISGNYFLHNSNKTVGRFNAVTQDRLASGEITMAMNAAINNRLNTNTPVFRQNLGSSIYPTLDPNADVVTETISNYNLTQKVDAMADFLLAITNLTSQIELTGDIDLSGNVIFSIFSESYPFSGSIQGNGHTIKNMRYQATENQYDDDYDLKVGLFSYAKDATFENFRIENFHITQNDEWIGDHNVEALLVANSNHCTYRNVSLSYSDITVNDDKDYLASVGGIVAISNNDTFENCSLAASCVLEGHTSTSDTYIGGIASKAKGSEFLQCYNAATINADDNRNGGIVAEADGCTFTGCLNNGKIIGKDYTAGIVGYAKNGTVISKCVNLGTIRGYNNSSYDYQAGIVGLLDGSASEIANTLNFGEIEKPDDYCGPIYGKLSGDAKIFGYNLYNCDYNGGVRVNLVDKTIDKTWTIEEMKSGAFAYSKYFNQSIDNSAFDSEYPVPLPMAGEVYSVMDCDGNETYSNIYHNESRHSPAPNVVGICNVCGKLCGVPEAISISNAQDLVSLSYGVNRGYDYSNSPVSLSADIDFSGMDNFTPIGTGHHPFRGTFNGNGHRIKNMVIDNNYFDNTGQALFGNISGKTTIKNVEIDSTCVIRSKSRFAAGIVGVATVYDTINLINCGNAADVTGPSFTAGVIGGMIPIATSNMKVNISQCYNVGDINATSNAAAICSFAGCNFKITDSWNAGDVKGYVDHFPFIYYDYEATFTKTITNSYNLETLNGSLPKISVDDALSGKLAFKLNGEVNGKDGNDAWYQEIGVDMYPYFSFKRNDNALVYQHSYVKCTDTNVTCTTYTNTADYPSVAHEYGDAGICTAKAGETHLEEPEFIYEHWRITKPGHLYWVANTVNSGGTQHDCFLANDITDNADLIVDGALNTQANLRTWTPIGTQTHPYNYVIYGDCNTISGLYASGSYVGLIGCAGSNSGIYHLGVKDFWFDGSEAVGALIGFVNHKDGTAPFVSACYADGIIHTSKDAGGLIGTYQYESKPASAVITNSYSTCRIVDKNNPGYKQSSYVGSLIGRVGNVGYKDGMVSNSYYRKENIDGLSGYGTAKTDVAFRTGEICKLLGAGWKQALDVETAPTYTITPAITYRRAVNANTWGTLILPFAVTSNDDIQYYTCSDLDENNVLHLTETETVPANTPCFFKTSEGCSEISYSVAPKDITAPEDLTVSMSHETSTNDIVRVVGSYDARTISPSGSSVNYYVAQNQLWWGEEAFTLPAFRAYLQTPQTSNSKSSISIFVDDDATQIGEIDADGNINFFNGKYLERGKVVIIKNGKKYNANGQRLK